MSDRAGRAASPAKLVWDETMVPEGASSKNAQQVSSVIELEREQRRGPTATGGVKVSAGASRAASPAKLVSDGGVVPEGTPRENAMITSVVFSYGIALPSRSSNFQQWRMRVHDLQ